jgi:hypothetical protein
VKCSGACRKNIPKVTWTIVATTETTIGTHPVLGRQLAGHVDNSAHPANAVDIQLIVVTPAGAKQPVPLMIMIGGRALPGLPGFTPPGGGRAGAPPPAAAPPAADPPATEQLIAAGWGYASISPSSIQADNGAGLTKGIIGLVNRGQPRKPDDWGSLRAWAWGASRALDYLETDRLVDAKKVGIEGVSRFGKAALVAMAFDTRFAVVLVGSSGEGGAKLHRRNWGEAVENLTASGEYHWMAGNFLKYGAADATFGSRNAGDLPVDAHELIALCAPRPTFISYGVPEKGDASGSTSRAATWRPIAAGPCSGCSAPRISAAPTTIAPRRCRRERRTAGRTAGLAAARRRTHRRSELEVLHSLGGPPPEAQTVVAARNRRRDCVITTP